METQPHWTIDELAHRVGLALADGYGGQRNRRVRDIPDVRSIRWYSTIGLLDKPLSFRGRTALYGQRHLRQLVAVKRRQAQGATLAEIQAELAGASDADLGDMAGALADDLLAEPTGEYRFWAAPVRVPMTEHGRSEATQLSYGVKVHDGVTILFDGVRPPDSADLAAITDAAAELPAVLRDRGLLPPDTQHEREGGKGDSGATVCTRDP